MSTAITLWSRMLSPVRILIVNHEYPPRGGGSGVATRLLAQGLVRRGHAVRVLTAGGAAPMRDDQGVQVSSFANSRWGFLRRAHRQIRKTAREFQPDVVNSQFLFPAGFAVARARLETPHVASMVGADVHDPTRWLSADNNWLVRRATKHCLRRADALTSSSDDLTRRIQACFPHVRPHKIPWPVEPLPTANASRRQLGLPEDAFVIATLGRLVKRKRFDLLLQACQASL